MTTLPFTIFIVPRKYGELREDGYRYHSMRKDGYEQWYSPLAWRRAKIRSSLDKAKKRAAAKALPFDLTVDYLISIFPQDCKCPALGIELVWGDADGRSNSPSLDRIVPEDGYVEGNVRWLSQLANQIKSNATTAEICAVADYLRKID